VVEVHDVIVHGVRGQDQVTDVLGVQRDFQLQRVLDGADGRNRVHGRAHPAKPLGEQPGISRVPSLQDDLDAPPHLTRRPRLAHLAAVDFDVDP